MLWGDFVYHALKIRSFQTCMLLKLVMGIKEDRVCMESWCHNLVFGCHVAHRAVEWEFLLHNAMQLRRRTWGSKCRCSWKRQASIDPLSLLAMHVISSLGIHDSIALIMCKALGPKPTSMKSENLRFPSIPKPRTM